MVNPSKSNIIQDLFCIKKMETLKLNIQWCHLLGILTVSESKISKVFAVFVNFIVSVHILFIIIASLFYFAFNLSDMAKATYAVYVAAAISLSLSQYWIFLWNQKLFRTLLLETQRTVNESMRNSILEKEKIEIKLEIILKLQIYDNFAFRICTSAG